MTLMSDGCASDTWYYDDRFDGDDVDPRVTDALILADDVIARLEDLDEMCSHHEYKEAIEMMRDCIAMLNSAITSLDDIRF